MKQARLRVAWASLVFLVATGASPSRGAGAAAPDGAASGQGKALEVSLAKGGTWDVTASALLVGATAIFPKKDTAQAEVTFPAEGQLKADFKQDPKVGPVTFTKRSAGCRLVVVTDKDKQKLLDALKANPVTDLMAAVAAAPLTGTERVREAAEKVLEADPPPPTGPENTAPEILGSLTRTYDLCYEVAEPEHMPAGMDADTKTKVEFVLVVLSPTEMRSSTYVPMEGGSMVQWHSWTYNPGPRPAEAGGDAPREKPES